MLKKTLSLFLCIVMCISFFSMTAVETMAAYNVKTLFTVKSGAVENDKLNYSISVTKGQENIGGIILVVKFDSSVLKPVNCSPAQTNNVDNFAGTFVHGVSKDNPDFYNIAYVNQTAVSTTQSLAFFNMQFEIIDETRPTTDIEFYCKEYFSVSEPEKNITVSDGLQLIDEFKEVPTLSKPVLKDVVPYQDGLKVSWKPVEGAAGYEIRRTSLLSTWESVGIVGATETEFYDDKLTSGTTYTYTVRAFNNYGYSLYDAIGITFKYIQKPVVKSVENAVGGVEIKWSEAPGADFYIIVRRAAGETEWSQVGKTPSSADTYFKDTTVVDGVSYEYDVNSATDSFISATSDSGMNITYIASPSINYYANTLEGIEIRWNAHPDAVYYIVYKKIVGVQSELLECAQVAGNVFVDKNVTPGKPYTYSVKACTNNGNSAYSLTGYTVTRVPSTVVTALSLEKNAVRVEWEAVSGVTGYTIYRKSSGETTWTRVAPVGAETLSFSDTNVSSGAEYRYAVCPMISASEGAKIESAPIYYIKAPENITAENIIEGIKITWPRINGATKYEVMRMDANGDFNKVAEVDGAGDLEFLDTDVIWKNSYVYGVKAVSSKGESLVGNSTAPIMRIGAMGIATPELAEGGIKVTWEPSEFADGYDVFRNVGGTWTQVASVENAEYLDENVVNNEIYSYAVAVIIDGSRGVLETTGAPEMKYIAPPTTVKTASSYNYITVSWDAMDGATGYELYKWEDGEPSDKALIASFDSATFHYIDSDIVAGKTYNYVVRTINDGKVSKESVPAKISFLATPQITSISNTYTGVSFVWGAVEGAKEYYVYRKVSNGAWEYVAAVSAEDALVYTDTSAVSGQIMGYTVRAVNNSGISSFVAKYITYVAAPKLAYSNAYNGVYLKWDSTPGAKSYWIFRKAGNSAYWTKIAEVSTTYYTDVNASSGVDYTYTIRAYNGQLFSGYNTAGWKITHLRVPQLVSAVNGYGAVTCSWKQVPGATGYNVYRRVDGSKTWTYVGSTTGLFYKDTNVNNKSTYTYTVRAYKGTSLSSFNSAGVSVKYLTAPNVTVANRVDSVQLTWNAVPGASSYYVYRKIGNSVYWTHVATVSQNYYVDTKVNNATVYTYTVRAYGSKTLSGYYATGWKTLYLAAPKLVSAISYSGGISVKWQPNRWAKGYFIFRKTGNGNWEQIGTVSGYNSVVYFDRTAQKGVKYTYTVRAYNGIYRSWFYPGLTCVDKY